MIMTISSTEKQINFLIDLLGLGGHLKEEEELWQMLTLNDKSEIKVKAHFPTVQRTILRYLLEPARFQNIILLGKKSEREEFLLSKSLEECLTYALNYIKREAKND